MQGYKNLLPFLLGILLLSACGETLEKKSNPKILLNETEKQLPASTLKEANQTLESTLLTELPKLENFEKLTKTIDQKNQNIILKTVKWTPAKTYVTMMKTESGGKFRYETYYKCTQGFWTCQSGYTVDDRFKLEDKSTETKYIIDYILGFPKSYTQKDQNGKIIQKKREYISNVEANVDYTMIFNNVPLEALRTFNLFENYCTSDSSSWNVCGINIKYFDQEIQEQSQILALLNQQKLELISIKALRSIYKKYSKYDAIKELIIEKILIRLKQKNSIEELHQFNKTYTPLQSILNQSIDKIYALIKIKDSVAGYEWYIKNYSNTKYSKLALQRIHEIMFSKAKKVDTISAYNSFIFIYPTAKQVGSANELANKQERELYTNLGYMSFWDTDHKKEKKSRKLLIRAKQIERFPRDNNIGGNRKAGYAIVANRMYTLLQEEFNDSDATLRHLESQEFKDFVRDFKSIMNDIKYTLDKINQNSSNNGYYLEKLLTISQEGFSDAKADRAMAAYHAKEHTQWDKRMHFQDKGYQ